MNSKQRVVDRAASAWEYLGGIIQHRPTAVAGVIVGLCIWIATLVYVAHTREKVDVVQHAFCNGKQGQQHQTAVNLDHCRQLLDTLLDSAEDKQKARIRAIIREGKNP